MRPKVSGIFKYSSPSVKVSGVWRNIDKVFVNVAGVWKTSYSRGVDNIVTNAIGDVVASTSGWVYDTTRGWYKNDYNWAANMPVKFSAETLSRIRKVTAEFTSYNSNPAGSIGVSLIAITTNLGVTYLGTYDGNTDSAVGQVVYPGDSPYYQTTGNIINQTFTYTLKSGEVISSMALQSSGYNNGTAYPYGLRGMKNFKFELV